MSSSLKVDQDENEKPQIMGKCVSKFNTGLVRTEGQNFVDFIDFLVAKGFIEE
jgi:hypothetical protein